MTLSPTPDLEITMYRASLVVVSNDVDEEDDYLFHVTLVQADPGESVDDVLADVATTRTRISFIAPAGVEILFPVGSEHTLSGEITTVVPRAA